MLSQFELLESRQLFSGGVDASFGSASGAHFVAPGNSPVILDSDVDSSGRVVLVGTTSEKVQGKSHAEMFLARLNSRGTLDSKFGSGGIIEGTPKGIQGLGSITHLPEGGYIAATGGVLGGVSRLIAFHANGLINRSFGKDGVVALQLPPSQILRQSDGKLLVVGLAGNLDPDETDAFKAFYAFRYTANGKLDTTYGDNGRLFLNDALFEDTFNGTTTVLTSATLDSSNRLVITLASLRGAFMEDGEDLGGSSQTFLRRYTAVGAQDFPFGDVAGDVTSIIFNKGRQANGPGLPSHLGVSVVRPDGEIAVLARDNASDDPLTVTLVGINGEVGSHPVSANLSTLVPGFVVPGLADGSMTVFADNSMVIAGTIKSGSTRKPALIRLNANLTLDTTFGASGVMRLPTTGGQQEATNLALNTDGTFDAITLGARTNGNIPSDVRIDQLFRDDRPVITFAGAKQIGASETITVSIRGVNSINLNSLDDNDLRLIDQNDLRKKLHLLHFAQASDGTIIATYRISRSVLHAGTYSIRTIASQVSDTKNNSNTSRTIGTVTI
ncbi:MAG TPA: hypothetical protein VHS31_13455 [Tepidisphaeraceae bacterium]|jgi:uncharacterized delta-60 repeat protein|nr:hypothetical protein [Tepidisphaeraceae bacterium]